MRRRIDPARGSQLEGRGLRSATPSRWHHSALMLDGFVDRIYRTGCVQSVILNTSMLLALAILVIRPATDPDRVALSVQFQATVEPALDFDAPPALALLEEPLAPEEREQSLLESPVAFDDVTDATVEVAEADFDSFAARPADEPDVADLLTEVAVTPTTGASSPVQVVSFESVPRVGAGGGGGIGGELGRRLQAAGAQSGDVQVSMRWDDLNDIDVHVTVEPFGDGRWSIINWMNRMGMCGGMLDVDANAAPTALMRSPVENIFWGRGRAPYGRYTVMVHHFRSWSGNARTTVELAVLVDGEVRRFYPVAISGEAPQVVASFVRQPRNKPVIHSASTSTLSQQVAP